jgi:hypothetical protein
MKRFEIKSIEKNGKWQPAYVQPADIQNGLQNFSKPLVLMGGFDTKEKADDAAIKFICKEFDVNENDIKISY